MKLRGRGRLLVGVLLLAKYDRFQAARNLPWWLDLLIYAAAASAFLYGLSAYASSIRDGVMAEIRGPSDSGHP